MYTYVRICQKYRSRFQFAAFILLSNILQIGHISMINLVSLLFISNGWSISAELLRIYSLIRKILMLRLLDVFFPARFKRFTNQLQAFDAH